MCSTAGVLIRTQAPAVEICNTGRTADAPRHLTWTISRATKLQYLPILWGFIFGVFSVAKMTSRAQERDERIDEYGQFDGNEAKLRWFKKKFKVQHCRRNSHIY